jgi:UDP-3-O-[3-hydroxymyristoyl] glucosamine N-acyltransferase
MPTRTLSELADLCGAVLDGDGTRVVEGLASLREATPREISFYANPRYREDLEATRAAAVVVGHDVPSPRKDLALLRCKDPNRAFTAVIGAFHEGEPAPLPGVHPSAVVDPEARVDASASIGPLCWVGPGALVGERAILQAGVTIGRDASVGAESVLHCGVRVYARVAIGARCIIHSGTVLGSDGYGFEPTREGWAKIPQVGTVVVEDEVEIGANCAVDRGRFGATRIGRGAKLDNLVHVAHNVVIGEAALVIAQVGIAGSTRIGKRAILAGQAGIAGHVVIGDGARLGAQAGVSVDIPPGQDWIGSPAHPRGETLRSWTLMTRLPELNGRVRDLERKLARLEQSLEASIRQQTGEDTP